VIETELLRGLDAVSKNSIALLVSPLGERTRGSRRAGEAKQRSTQDAVAPIDSPKREQCTAELSLITLKPVLTCNVAESTSATKPAAEIVRKVGKKKGEVVVICEDRARSHSCPRRAHGFSGDGLEAGSTYDPRAYKLLDLETTSRRTERSARVDDPRGFKAAAAASSTEFERASSCRTRYDDTSRSARQHKSAGKMRSEGKNVVRTGCDLFRSMCSIDQ